MSSMIYIRSIVQGQTIPHRTTRLVLLVITLLSTSSLLPGGLNAAFWLAFVSMLQGVVIFVLSIRRGYGGWAILDICCLAIAFLGILIWQATGMPLLGLLASIFADGVGMVPAIVKTYKLPYTENWQFFAIDTAAGSISIVALSTFTVHSLSFPLYVVAINGMMTWLILWRRRGIPQKTKIVF